MSTIDVNKRWSFDDIPEGFDAHIKSQLPFYDMLNDMLVKMIRHYCHDHASVADIGSATGNLGKLFINTYGYNHRLFWTNVEPCASFIPDPDEVEYDEFEVPYFNHEATNASFYFENKSQTHNVIVANLTLSFMNPQWRRELIETMKGRLRDGGALIIVDKFIMPESYLSTIMRTSMWAHKAKQKVSTAKIVEKELSLAGAQSPLRVDDCKGMHRFFQYGEFIGFVYEKP